MLLKYYLSKYKEAGSEKYVSLHSDDLICASHPFSGPNPSALQLSSESIATVFHDGALS